MDSSNRDLDINDALTLKSAELWLEVGMPAYALREMNALGDCSRAHPWAAELLQSISATAALQSANPAAQASLGARVQGQ